MSYERDIYWLAIGFLKNKDITIFGLFSSEEAANAALFNAQEAVINKFGYDIYDQYENLTLKVNQKVQYDL